MTLWVMLAATLAGMNLVRITGRGVVVAGVLVIALAVAAVVGWLAVDDWRRATIAVAMSGAAILLWRHLVLNERSGRQAWGLVASGTAIAVLVVAVRPAAPLSADPWLWVVAFFVLADPATRLLRWLMRGMGKTPNTVSAAYGRGEAIGVLERWLTLIMVVRGDYAALAFIIAAKALARHQRFEQDPDFAEYFLVGTLISVLMAVAVAEGLRAV